MTKMHDNAHCWSKHAQVRQLFINRSYYIKAYFGP